MNEGSYGGQCGKDAMDSVDNLMINTRNNPIEELDMRFPVRCERYELRDTPAAPGRWRGGIGIVRENRFLVNGTYSSEGDRHVDPPRGIFGGADGMTAQVTKNPGTPGSESLYAKVTGFPCGAQDLIRLETPNGAGYGNPLEWLPELVRADVLDGFTTRELTLAAYGVVLGPAPSFDVHWAATEARRGGV